MPWPLELQAQALNRIEIINLIVEEHFARYPVHPSVICSAERSCIIFAASENTIASSWHSLGSKFNQEHPVCPCKGINKGHWELEAVIACLAAVRGFILGSKCSSLTPEIQQTAYKISKKTLKREFKAIDKLSRNATSR